LLNATFMRTSLLVTSLLVAATPALAAERTICVSVTVRAPQVDQPPPQLVPAPDAEEVPMHRPALHAGRLRAGDDSLPMGQDPPTYLKRLVEYFVTHERGFVAVQSGCQDHLDIELYPLREGWTAFARYSGTGREERVDTLLPDEMSQFAERAALALLYDKPISTTIKRDTVLRADSRKATQRIRGTHHFLLGVGTQVRGGRLPTSQPDGSATDQIRVFGPIAITLGYRAKFESWGLETLFNLVIGTSKTGLSQNDQGGHVDYGGNVGLALHFLRYLNPRGLTSWYLGAGGSFEAMWFYQIRPLAERGDSRATRGSGGFDIDVVAGVEFMRASKVQFLLQAALLAPAYVVENGDGAKPIKTWFPGASLTLGMLF
jgi:hypothetical protein